MRLLENLEEGVFLARIGIRSQMMGVILVVKTLILDEFFNAIWSQYITNDFVIDYDSGRRNPVNGNPRG